MPSLSTSAERCVLKIGVNTLGGRGANSLPIAALGSLPPAATLTMPLDGPAVLQRLTARVVVRLNGQPLGPQPVEIRNGSLIEVSGCRMVFEDVRVRKSVVSEQPAAESSSAPTEVRPAVPAAPPKAYLVDLSNAKRFELASERFDIGRDTACAIVINGSGVSRHHASVSYTGGSFLVADRSANGTLVNGARIRGTHPLQPGDVIRIQEREFRFEMEGEVRPVRALSETTVLKTVKHRSAMPTPTARRSSPLAARLTVARGPLAGATFHVERAVCAIGRAEQNDVRLVDESVSAAHATLLCKGDTWYVVDLRSVNGTFVNGYRVAGERVLPAGATLRLGRVELTFQPIATDPSVNNGTRHIVGLFQRLSKLLERSPQ